jgi:PAS domain S-box-containing protein
VIYLVNEVNLIPVVSILVLVFGIALGLLISDIVSTPMRKLRDDIREMKVDEIRRIDIENEDEIGEITFELNELIERLNKFHKKKRERLISARRRLIGIIKAVADGVIVTDSSHRIVLMNPSAEKIFGVSEEEALGTQFLETIKDEMVFKSIKDTFTERKNRSFMEEIPVPKASSHKKTFSIVTSLIGNAKEKPFGVVTLFQDVTSLTELNRMKSDFISTVSHELRTPLTSIKMGVELMLERIAGEINEKQESLLNAAREDVNRLIRLISNLLDLSRIESGKIKMKIEPINLVSIIDEVLFAFRSQAEEKKIILKSTVERRTIELPADKDRIKEVLTNLVSNAIKFTDKGGRITVDAEESEEYVDVSVADTGIGIRKEDMEKIFDKFGRIEKGYAYQEEGTGLGLPICKEIVEAHKGKIWVESEYLKGSKFVFRLPKKIVE